MSRKSNRLKNRLRIERDLAAAKKQWISRAARQVDHDRAKIEADRRDLDRRASLRIFVEQPFEFPMGDMFAIRIVIHPREFDYAFRMGSDKMHNQTHMARGIGQQLARQVEDVILRCINGELEAFQKASR